MPPVAVCVVVAVVAAGAVTPDWRALLPAAGCCASQQAVAKLADMQSEVRERGELRISEVEALLRQVRIGGTWDQQ